jgi:hypothetical protein
MRSIGTSAARFHQKVQLTDTVLQMVWAPSLGGENHPPCWLTISLPKTKSHWFVDDHHWDETKQNGLNISLSHSLSLTLSHTHTGLCIAWEIVSWWSDDLGGLSPISVEGFSVFVARDSMLSQTWDQEIVPRALEILLRVSSHLSLKLQPTAQEEWQRERERSDTEGEEWVSEWGSFKSTNIRLFYSLVTRRGVERIG